MGLLDNLSMKIPQNMKKDRHTGESPLSSFTCIKGVHDYRRQQRWTACLSRGSL